MEFYPQKLQNIGKYGGLVRIKAKTAGVGRSQKTKQPMNVNGYS